MPKVLVRLTRIGPLNLYSFGYSEVRIVKKKFASQCMLLKLE